MKNESILSFQTLWENACQEQSPNPQGAAGALISAIAEKLDADAVEDAKVGQVAFFLWDVSHLGFKGMELNVVMIAQPPQNQDELAVLSRMLSEYKYAVQSIGYCFVLLLASEPPSFNYIIPGSLEVVLLTGKDLSRLFASSVPVSVLYEILSAQVHLERLCPFNTTREVRGALFKGRRKELDALVQDRDTNYAIVGARRIGKTSLLCRAHGTLRAIPDWRPRVYSFNCLVWGDFWDCWDRMAHALDVRKEARIEHGLRNISYLLDRVSVRGNKPLLLLFDEVDRIIDIDRGNDWNFFRSLAEATQNRWIRIAIAGYRSLARLMEDRDAPFYRAIELIEMTALTKSETIAVVADPFGNMDIKVENESEFHERLWHVTRGYPFVVQLVGQELFQYACSRSPRLVTPEDIDKIGTGNTLREFLFTHFLQNTLEQGNSILTERLCCAVLAHSNETNPWVEGDFLQACEDAELPQTLDSLHAALTNLCRAHIFSRVQGKYSFTFPLMQDILQSAYPDSKLLIHALARS